MRTERVASAIPMSLGPVSDTFWEGLKAKAPRIRIQLPVSSHISHEAVRNT